MSESKCAVVEKEVNLGQCQVCQKVEAIITLRNQQKFPSVFNVASPLPMYTEITPMKGKMGPDQSMVLKVVFYSKQAVKVSSEIEIKQRGGKSLFVPFSIHTMVPELNILENQFDFGTLTTLEKSKELPSLFLNSVTFVNLSPVPAKIILDLRESVEDQNTNGIDCLELSPMCVADDNESSIMKSIDDTSLLDLTG